MIMGLHMATLQFSPNLAMKHALQQMTGRFESFFSIFLSVFFFFHNYSQITGLQGKGEGISLTPHYHFHPLHRHLDISWAITAESSLLHIGSSQT